MPELSIIIVNYNTAGLTLQCIRSIYEQQMTCEFEIIVVDNLSTDNSKSTVLDKYPDVIWIENKINEGFGRANNIGIKEAKGEYILLLNSDTLIIENTIEKALFRFKKEPIDVGMITCQLLNPDSSKQKSIFYFNASFKEVLNNNLLFDFIVNRSNPKKQTEIKALHGAFLLFQKKRFDKIGFFDPDFFLYAEEFEWCYRIQKNGLKLKFYEDFNIIHLEEGSSVSKKWNIKQRNLSGALLFKKTHGTFGLILYLIFHFFNIITNTFLMWKLDSKYRKDFMTSQKLFWSLLIQYFKVIIDRFQKPLRYKP